MHPNILRLTLIVISLVVALLAGRYQAHARLSQLVSIKNNVIQTGRLTVTAAPAEAWFAASNLAPGEQYDRKVTVSNNGSVSTRLMLTARKAAGYSTVFNALRLRIAVGNSEIFNDSLSKLSAVEIVSALPPQESLEADLRLYLPADVNNEAADSYTNVTFDLIAEQI